MTNNRYTNDNTLIRGPSNQKIKWYIKSVVTWYGANPTPIDKPHCAINIGTSPTRQEKDSTRHVLQ